PNRNPVDNRGAGQASLSPEAIETEVTIVTSPEIARAVVSELNLQNDPEFNPTLNKDGPKLSRAEQIEATAGVLLANLSVSRDKLTYIIGIRFTSKNALKSAQIANAFADRYLATKVGSNMGDASQQVAFFQKRLEELGNEVRQADAAAAQYRVQSGLVTAAGANSGTITDQQIVPLSSSLAAAEAEAAAARAAYTTAQAQMARGGIEGVAEVRNSPVIADLRRQRAEVLRNMGEVTARYGELHPESIKIRDQLKGLDQQISEESRRAIASLQAQAVTSEASANSLRGTMNRLGGVRSNEARASVMADSLEREAAAKRDAYNKVSQMSLDSTQASRNQISQAVIVARASPAGRPTSPNKPLLFALSLIVGLSAGAATIATQEMLVSGMRSISDVESALGLPVLAAVPMLPKSARPGDLILDKPTSLFAESFRIARAAILGVRSKKPPQIIAITSSLPSEGKTTTALSFARVLAMNGANTLLIDCDVRRASMRESVPEHPDVPGIVEVLHGEATLDSAIVPSSRVPRLDQMLVKTQFFSSENLFGGGDMEQILADLRGRYDHIVLDLPPLIGLADGRFLAVLADATALVIRWDSTPPEAAATALSWLRTDGANPVGAIYTMVDSSAEAIGGLYYSKKYSGYYQPA
ncbi:MAG: AAA family ATPase, partial [Aliihoeflea sp.]